VNNGTIIGRAGLGGSGGGLGSAGFIGSFNGGNAACVSLLPAVGGAGGFAVSCNGFSLSASGNALLGGTNC
jgi:hypothetical protein